MLIPTMTNDDQQKPPSELSFDIFVTNVVSDETLPPAVRTAVTECKEKSVNELLTAIKLAIGETR